jgi:multiple sugar transport system permease protein
MSGRATIRERWVLIAPAFALLLAVVAVPILRVLWLSLFHADLVGHERFAFAGFDQYVRLWNDARWLRALGNTVMFTCSSVATELLLGLAFALLLHRAFRGRGWVRALVTLPWVLPTAIMALAWAWIANDSFGVANDLLQRLGILRAPVAWLGEPATAMATIVLADTWKTTPFVMLVLLAGLQGIPDSVIEAARLDGLSNWHRLTRVILPLLLPSILVAGLFRLIQAYGAFDLIYVMTGGGPGGATETVSLYAYRNYFRYLDFGYGSALAVQAVALVALASWAIVRWAREPGEAEA